MRVEARANMPGNSADIAHANNEACGVWCREYSKDCSECPTLQSIRTFTLPGTLKYKHNLF